ncbi:unnamed protein product [Rotaria magnacalcarata]|uniref:Uncharacterized protein n=1 Tax=Rotaria magnacalcarata TaxID=392030 RepID=A0A819S0B0_9BILA|nr:unnamed protein product [Rotaria magnacalcarata]CAF4123514.1 unnamed protein product [Rotaria magnacalcarata]
MNFQNTLEKLQVMDERNQSLSLKCHRTNGTLTYAAAIHMQPFKLECVPKMNDQKEAAKFIQHFFKLIENNFDQQNNYHDRPTGFDQWWIDKEVDIIGILHTRNRQVRIDFQDKTEYNTNLNSGKVSIYGQLIDCDHRCGKDRNDKEDHNLCEIKCNHCDGPHRSTDYSCSFIQQYRREPVLELRNHPDLFPAEAQLFIPTECRESGKGTKILENKSAQYEQFKKNQNQHYHPFNHLSSDYKNQWPSLPHSSSDSRTSISNNNLNNTIESLKDELNLLKENYASEQTKIE